MNNSLFSAIVPMQTVHNPCIKAAEIPQRPLTESPLSPGSPCSPGFLDGPVRPLNHIKKKSVTF